MKNDTIMTWHLVKDHMIMNSLMSYNIEIKNYVLVSTRLACNLFETHQAETKEAKKTKTSKDQKVVLSIEIVDVLSKSGSLVQIFEMLEKYFVECVTETERKQDIKIACKANAVKRKLEENRESTNNYKRLWTFYKRKVKSWKQFLDLSPSSSDNNFWQLITTLS